LLKEALAPPTDDLARQIQMPRNLLVLPPLGRKEDDLGTDHLAIWRRITPDHATEGFLLIV